MIAKYLKCRGDEMQKYRGHNNLYTDINNKYDVSIILATLIPQHVRYDYRTTSWTVNKMLKLRLQHITTVLRNCMISLNINFRLTYM